MTSDAWHITILYLSGLRLMRAEKAWRPIVTVEVESGKQGGAARAGGVYETMLGVDGQCVNQRESMIIHDAPPSAKIEINIWHRSQSKKKKRRILVASTSCCLGELAKKQEVSDGKLDIRLTCRSSDTKGSSAARGRPQNGAAIRLKIRPPISFKAVVSAPQMHDSPSTSTLRPTLTNAEAGPSRSSTLDTVSTNQSVPSVSSIHKDEEAGHSDAEFIASPVSEKSEAAWFGEDVPDLVAFDEPPQQQTLRRRRIKGYAIDTDDECASVSASECYSERDHLLPTSHSEPKDDDVHSNTFVGEYQDEDDDLSRTPHPSHLTLSLTRKTQTTLDTEELIFRASTGDIISFSSTTTDTGEKVWIAAASDVLLPMYTEKVVLPPKKDMLFVERLLAAFTLYGEMRSAHDGPAFQPIARRLQNEWAVVGTLLLALAGVNTALFTVQSDGMFTVSEKAQLAVAISSVTSGLGIACTAWFFMRYNWADIETFITRSRDVFGTHFFFALSARVPALCMFISACALTACLALIAFGTFPGGVLVLCFLIGILMSLQFIVFGVSWIGRQVVTGSRAGGERVRGVVQRVRGMTGPTTASVAAA